MQKEDWLQCIKEWENIKKRAKKDIEEADFYIDQLRKKIKG